MPPLMRWKSGQTDQKKRPDMVLQVLLWLGTVVLVISVLFVLLPIRVVLSWHSDPVRPSTVFLRPFGGVSPPIKVYDSTRKRKPKKPPATARKRHHKGVGRGWNARGDVMAELSRLLGRLIGAVQIEDLHIDAAFGLGDPAETGQLYGQLTPLIYTTRGHVQLHPDFETACLQGSAVAQVRFALIGLIWPLVAFGWRVFGPLQ